MNNIESLSYFTSEIALLVGILGLLLLAIRRQPDTERYGALFASFALIFALVAAIFTHFEKSTLLFKGMIALDPFGQFFKTVILAAALVTVIMASRARDLERSPKTEFYAFLLALTLGLNLMSVASDLLMIYLALEMSSIVSYVMAGYLAESKRSEESGLKYVLYGGVASGVMIFGISLLYGLTGTLNLVAVRTFLMENPTDRLVLFVTFVMILAGLGYKMAIAPFHMWSPDVYEGAPMPVTAYLSVGSKAAGFAVTLRFFLAGFVAIDAEGTWSVLKAVDWQFLIAALAAITMTVGNVIALKQTNIKRFLAYSSVAHAGYMLMGVAVQSRVGIESILFYFLVYFLMNLGAFFVAILISNQWGTEEIKDYRGLVRQNAFGTFLTICMAIFMFSLTGLPPFAGFIGKWYLFQAVIDSGLIWLAVVAAINSVIALFYYVRVVKYMAFDPPVSDKKLANRHWRYASVIAVFAVLSVYFGIYFAPLANWAKYSAEFFY